MRAYKRLGKEGFTLVELMIVVAIIGVLAALAIYGVTRYFANAKTAEAKNTIGAISRSAASAYEREISRSEILTAGSTGSATSQALCNTAQFKIPQTMPAGNKVNPDPADQSVDPPDTGWTCLRFTLTQPVLYQYSYESPGGAVSSSKSGSTTPPSYAGGAGSFEAAAQGDLDNDTTVSTFARGGVIDTATKSLTLATQVWVDNEYE